MTKAAPEAAPAVPRIEAHYDSRKEWRADPKGYFLIKVFYAKGEIGARFMDYGRNPVLDIYGADAETIAQTAVREGLVSSLQHAAYLGSELRKAETALRLKLEYVQDAPLDFSKKTKKKESSNRASE